MQAESFAGRSMEFLRRVVNAHRELLHVVVLLVIDGEKLGVDARAPYTTSSQRAGEGGPELTRGSDYCGSGIISGVRGNSVVIAWSCG